MLDFDVSGHNPEGEKGSSAQNMILISEFPPKE